MIEEIDINDFRNRTFIYILKEVIFKLNEIIKYINEK
jgi:hypothetical protein